MQLVFVGKASPFSSVANVSGLSCKKSELWAEQDMIVRDVTIPSHLWRTTTQWWTAAQKRIFLEAQLSRGTNYLHSPLACYISGSSKGQQESVLSLWNEKFFFFLGKKNLCQHLAVKWEDWERRNGDRRQTTWQHCWTITSLHFLTTRFWT